MKLITANKLNRFCQGIKAILVPKTRVLTTLTEISANTNSENVAGATAVKELNNNLSGVSFVVSDGKITGYKVAGADTVIPFSSDISGKFYLQHSQYHGNYYNTAYVTFDLGKKYRFLDLNAESQNGAQSKMYIFDETFDHGTAGNIVTTFTGSKILTQFDVSKYDRLTFYSMWVTYPNGNGEYKGSYRFYN